MLDYEKIGKFLQELRIEKGFSQESLANELYVTRQAISKWERGKSLPSQEMICTLCKLYNVTSNEIFMGERAVKKNKEELDNISLKIFYNYQTKLKKILLIMIPLFIILIIVFFSYYFFSTYNKMKVYVIGGESDDVTVENGLLMQSNDLIYFNIGKMRYYNDFQYDLINLYYLKDGEKQLVYEGIDDSIVLYDKKGYNYYFTYGDLGDIINNLYIEFLYNEFKDKKAIHLTLTERYANDKLFFEDLNPYSTGTTKFSEVTIPDKIRKEFTYNQEERIFVYEKHFKDYKLTLEYSPNNSSFAAKEEHDNFGKLWLYTFFENSIGDFSIDYLYIDNQNSNNNFSSILWQGDISCSVSKCPDIQKEYEYFMKKYKNTYIPDL